MRTELKLGSVFLYPDQNKKLKRKSDNKLYGAMILSKTDSIDNYEEVDEYWTPDNNYNEILPDINGSISYEEARKLLNEIANLKGCLANLQKNNNDMMQQLSDLEMSIYNR